MSKIGLIEAKEVRKTGIWKSRLEDNTVLVSASRMRGLRGTASDADSIFNYVIASNRKSALEELLVNETPTQSKAIMAGTAGLNVIDLPILSVGRNQATFGDDILSENIDNIVAGVNNTTAGQSTLWLDRAGSYPVEYEVDNTIEEIVAISNDGGAFTSFNMLAADNAALTVDVTGVVDPIAKTIALTVPSGTTVTALVGSFTTQGTSIDTVKVSTTEQVSGTTANNFTSAVSYLLTSAAPATIATYVVTVTVAS